MSDNFDDFRKKILFTKRQDNDIVEGETPLEPTTAPQGMIISVATPCDFEYAKMAAAELLLNHILVVRFDEIKFEDKQRAYDYLNGAAYMLNFDIKAVSQHVMLYAPTNVTAEHLRLSSILKK